ncbi:MAG: hypothetical protein N2B06_13945 [Clostridium sp.]
MKEKEGTDINIVSYHGGFERELETGIPTEKLTGENQGYELCEKVDISNTAIFDNHCTGFKHNVTMRDIIVNYKFPNTLKVNLIIKTILIVPIWILCDIKVRTCKLDTMC